MQRTALFHAVYDHAGQFRQTAVGEVGNERVHVGEAAVGIAIVELAQSADEHELVAVGAHGETLGGEFHIAAYFGEAVAFERIVCGGIKRVFYLHAETLVLGEIGVGEQGRPLAFGVFGLQLRHVSRRHLRHVEPRIEQEQVVVCIGHAFVCRVLREKPKELFLGELQFVELVFEDDAGMVQRIHYYKVGGGFVLVRERDLREIIFAFVGVVHGAVRLGFEGFFLLP